MLSSKASNNILRVESITPIILVIELTGNPKITIISVYSPHNGSPADEVEEFYKSLSETVEQVPLHNFLMIIGDFNAKLGPQDARFTFDNDTNRNGELLVDFMDEFNLFSANNNFMKPKGQLWTFEYPNGERAQLDYIIMRKKWKNSLKDARSYSSFSTVCSDHRIVSAYVKLSLRKSKPSKPNPMKSIDWKQVASDQKVSQEFAVEVHNRFQALPIHFIDNDSVDAVYENLIKTTEEVAIATLPKKKKGNSNKPCNTKKVKDARVTLKQISEKYHKVPTQAHKIQLIMAKKRLDDAYLDSEVDYINGKIQNLGKQHKNHQHHQAWKTIKELAGKTQKAGIRIKGGSAKARLLNWTNHFKSLLGKKSTLPRSNSLPSVQISEQLNIDTSSFSITELQTATKQLSTSKAFGPDNIPALIWKNEHFHQLLLDLCNHTFFHSYTTENLAQISNHTDAQKGRPVNCQ